MWNGDVDIAQSRRYYNSYFHRKAQHVLYCTTFDSSLVKLVPHLTLTARPKKSQQVLSVGIKVLFCLLNVV